MNSYEQKQQARKERLEGRAESAGAASTAAYERSHKATDGIVFGQPILVGHHSERRHRKALSIADSAMRQSVDQQKYADELSRRAAAVGTGGISSDDPEAIRKLREQLAALQANQEQMKAANKIVKAKKKTDAAKILELVALGYSEKAAADLLVPDYAGRVGFPSFSLTNSNANMRRIEKRIEQLEADAQRVSKDVEGNGYTYHEDTEENRVMFRFPGKPAKEVREKLQAHAFKWSPTRDAWVRKTTGNAIWAAEVVRAWLENYAITSLK